MRIGSFIATLVAIFCAMGIAADHAPKPQTHTVIIEGMRFQPAALTVAAGDTIVWINKDLVPHTATSAAGDFDSKDIQSSGSWRYKVSTKGDFAYICTFHPTMKAMLRVK